MCLPLSVITTSPFIGPLHLSGVSVFVYNFQFSLLWRACHLRLPLCCGQEPHTNRAATRRGARTRDLKLGTCACDGAPLFGAKPFNCDSSVGDACRHKEATVCPARRCKYSRTSAYPKLSLLQRKISQTDRFEYPTY